MSDPKNNPLGFKIGDRAMVCRISVIRKKVVETTRTMPPLDVVVVGSKFRKVRGHIGSSSQEIDEPTLFYQVREQFGSEILLVRQDDLWGPT